MFSHIFDTWFPTLSCVNHIMTIWWYIYIYWLYLGRIHIYVSFSSLVHFVVVEGHKLVAPPRAQNSWAVLATKYFRHSHVHVHVAIMCCHPYLHYVIFSSCSVLLKTHDFQRYPVYNRDMTIRCYTHVYWLYLVHIHKNVNLKPCTFCRRRVTQVCRPTPRTKLFGCACDKLFSTLACACSCCDNVLSLAPTRYGV